MKTVTRHIDSLNIDVEFIVGGNAQENLILRITGRAFYQY
jgi:hypothetical protein